MVGAIDGRAVVGVRDGAAVVGESVGSLVGVSVLVGALVKVIDGLPVVGEVREGETVVGGWETAPVGAPPLVGVSVVAAVEVGAIDGFADSDGEAVVGGWEGVEDVAIDGFAVVGAGRDDGEAVVGVSAVVGDEVGVIDGRTVVVRGVHDGEAVVGRWEIAPVGTPPLVGVSVVG